ncbi:uncharacterized protein LOC113565390 isoform X3 [Drosophila persimilis]|uniref:uncharacterized protein LOC113565390 isoform X3 n=1 Tax=Drosophila persimilis TaxID=7234 RepID=UPI000F097DEF|nr:uncharacterized protein LOC113565390 isoform X3 [Drosophila persimilis]
MWHRRRSFFKPKRCTIIFFSLLLIFIWVNHSNRDDDAGGPVPDAIERPSLSRSERLYQLAKQEHLKDRQYHMLKAEKDRTFVDTSRGYDTTTAIDVDFLENRNPKMTAKPASRYFVYSQKCKMPYADPFSSEALSVFTPAKLKTCTNESDLITLSFDRNLQKYKIHVNSQVLIGLAPDVSDLKCSYQEVTHGRNVTGKFYSILQQPVDITPDMPLDKNMNGIITECHDEKNPSRIIQKDAFPLVQVVNQTSRTGSHPVDIQPSVIMLGLDTMSRMNFRRTMPRTAEFVRKLGWFELEGYNKVADNTYPNLCTVLAGGTPEELKKICSFSYAEDQDSCPWIWRDYKKAGYSTAYGEDIVEDSVFSVHDSGFRHEPTDFYLRPLLMGLTHSMRTYRRFGYDYCLGRRITVSYLYDFCMQFAQRFIEELEQPAFGFFWSCTFTHDYHHGASSLDGIFMDYLELLETRQVFEKSIVILLSDHGERFGELVELSDGFLEERLPMLHIYLPPWFRKTYPKYAESLLLNRNRLSSPYDLHNTLRHILQLNASTSDQLPPLTNCPTSQSLLHTLPRERSCKDACIGDHFCSCNEFIAVRLNGDAYNIVKLTLYYINRWMILHHFNRHCDRLVLEELDNAERKLLGVDNDKETLYGTIMIYRLRFHTYPSGGRFEATVRYHSELDTLVDFDIGDVSRLNRYHNDSLCIKDKIAKKFCFCFKDGVSKPEWQRMIINFDQQITKESGKLRI